MATAMLLMAGAVPAARGDALEEDKVSFLAQQISEHWELPASTASTDVIVTISMTLAPDGRVTDFDVIKVLGEADDASRLALVAAARAAILHFRSEPFLGLPTDDYDSWRSMNVTFDPTRMASDP